MSNDKMKKEMRIAQLERAIANKYGEEAVKNPESGWDEEKEKSFQEQMKSLNKKLDHNSSFEDKVEVNGVLVSKKLLSRESNRTCPVCNVYSFSIKDDVYMTKFECCFKCYVKYVEDREDRWETGWRPKSENN
jgi:hypothetical protein